MKLSGEFVFDGNRTDVWELLRDPDELVKALPGAQSLTKVSENEYTGKMHVRVGPVSGVFSGKLTISEEVPPDSFTMQVDGRGAPGFVKGRGAITLTDHSDGKTHMAYSGDVQVGGRLASVGQRLVESVSKSMVKQGLETLNMALIAKSAPVAAETPAESASPAMTYTPPSEMEFAMGVAKDLLADAFTPENRPMWNMVAAGIFGFVFGYMFGRITRQ